MNRYQSMNAPYPSLCFEKNNRILGNVWTRILRKPLTAILLFFAVIFSNSAIHAEEVLVAVASNFIKPMQAISERFTAATGHKVKLSFGSSGKLMAQISHGAPFDLFLSADKDKVMRLLENGLAIQGTDFIYAQGRLVLWSNQQDFVDVSGDILKSDKFRHIAVADAKLAPYGKAAEQVIAALGVGEKLKTRVVKGENISQTYQFVRTGNAQLGFVALSQIQQHPDSLKGSSWLIPADYHQAIEQYAVTLNRAKHNPAATELSHFLQLDNTHALIRSFGYDLPALKLLAKSGKSCDYADAR